MLFFAAAAALFVAEDVLLWAGAFMSQPSMFAV
jgi:hypothetical protein